MLIGRLTRTIGLTAALLGAFGVTAPGCTDREPATGPANQLMVASRTDVAIALRTGRPQPTPLGGTYIGDIIAVTGYDFAPIATDNRVTIAGVPCPVLGSVVIDPAHEFGPFTALYVEVRNDVPAGAAQLVEVSRPAPQPAPDDPGSAPAPITLEPPAERIFPSAPTTVAIHRLAFATPAQGNVVHAVDVTAAPPAWIAPRDLGVMSGVPSAITCSPDGRFVLLAAGTGLQITAVADGSTVLHLPSFFAGAVGSMALSADGRLLAAGVYPAGKPPEVVVADLSWLAGYNFNVIAGTGLLVPGVPAPPAPARVAVGLGGAAPGGVTFNRAGTQLYVTLSSGVVQVFTVAPQSIPSFSHQLPMPAGAAPFGIALTPDDRMALVTEVAFGLLIPVDTADGGTQSPLLAGAQPIGPALTAGGAVALVADAAGGALRVFRTGANTVQPAQGPLALGFTPAALAVAPEGPGGAAGLATAVLVDGNRLRFVTVNTTTALPALTTASAGPFPNGVRLIATTSSR